MPYLLAVVFEDGNVRDRQFWVIEPLRYNMDYTPNLLVHLVRSVPAESSEYYYRVHSRKSVIQQTILATKRPVRRNIFLLTSSAHYFSSSPT